VGIDLKTQAQKNPAIEIANEQWFFDTTAMMQWLEKNTRTRRLCPQTQLYALFPCCWKTVPMNGDGAPPSGGAGYPECQIGKVERILLREEAGRLSRGLNL